MPKEIKFKFKENIVLADQSKQFRYVFLSENGFKITLPSNYLKNVPNEVIFQDLKGQPIAFQAVDAKQTKTKPNDKSTMHDEYYLYYYEHGRRKLIVFTLFNFNHVQSNVKYDVYSTDKLPEQYAKKHKNRYYVNSIRAFVSGPPTEEENNPPPMNKPRDGPEMRPDDGPGNNYGNIKESFYLSILNQGIDIINEKVPLPEPIPHTGT